MMRNEVIGFVSVKATHRILTKPCFHFCLHEACDETRIKVTVEIKDVIKFHLPKLRNEPHEISGFPTGLIPDPHFLNRRKTLDDRLVPLSQKKWIFESGKRALTAAANWLARIVSPMKAVWMMRIFLDEASFIR